MGILDGKTAIVTGGGAGIGRGIALALAGEGAVIVLAGRTAETLDAARDEIDRRGGRAASCVCDVSVSDDIDACIALAIATFGGVDILVNNAFLNPRGYLLDLSEETLQAAWETGPLAALRFMRRCHPHLVGGGAIVNVSSGASKAASSPTRGAYAMLKASLDALSRGAAMEWAADGIRVNVIMPVAETEVFSRFRAREPERAAAWEATVPLGRVGDPEADIGRAVVFLVGPDAAYLTGATLPLDGGTIYLR